MKRTQVINAFNTWMDNYVNNPEQFEHEWETVMKHLNEKDTFNYGASAVAYLESLLGSKFKD